MWYLLYARQRVENDGVFAGWILDRSEKMPDAAVAAADSIRPTASVPDGGDFRVMVPLSNPRTEKELITLGGAIAKQRGGTVHAVHIVQVPDQTPLERAEQNERINAESKKLLEQARTDAETFSVPVETQTVLSHRSFEEVFDAARTFDADQVVMGWGPASHGRAESRLDELTHDLPVTAWY